LKYNDKKVAGTFVRFSCAASIMKNAKKHVQTTRKNVRKSIQQNEKNVVHRQTTRATTQKCAIKPMDRITKKTAKLKQ
jgi:hypothetical protein